MENANYDRMIEEYETSLRLVTERLATLRNAVGIANKDIRIETLEREQKELEESLYHIKRYADKY